MKRWRLGMLAALCAVPGVACADPISVFAALEPVVGSWLASAAATVVSYGSYIVTAAAITYGQLETRRKAKARLANLRAKANASLTDRTVTLMQSDPPLRGVLGRTRVGGYILTGFTTDKTGTRTNGATYTKPDALRHLVVMIATHRCRAVHELLIDGVAVDLATLDGNGWATSSEWASTETVRREIVLAAGASWTAPGAVTVTSCVEQVNGGDDQRTGTYTVTGSGSNIVTNTSAFNVAVSLTYAQGNSSVRVSVHLGADNQAADSYLTGLLGSAWTAQHALAGITYAVVTLDLEDQRFQGGPPGMVFEVSGALIYDPRRNSFPNPLLTGAATGTLPAGASWGALRGLTGTVVGAGVDDDSGMLYADLRLQGTASTSGSAIIDLADNTNGVTAAAGQAWAARVGLRVMAVTTAPTYVRAELVSFNSGGTRTLETSGTSIDMTVGPLVRWAEVADAALVSGTAKAGLRLAVGLTSGLVYDLTLRVMLPQLWQGTLYDDATDVTHWTDNNALQIAWFLRSYMGFAVAWDDVNDSALIVAANACDAAIPMVVNGVETTGPTYTGNGSFTTDEDREAVLDSMARCMGGFVSQGADWRIIAGAWTVPALTLDDQDLDGPIEIVQAGASMDELFNAVRSQYAPSGETTPAESVYINSVFSAADGQELWTDSQLDWVDHPARVMNLQRIMTERIRSGQVIRAPYKLKAWPVQVGERVNVNCAELGWVDKPFQVTDWGFGITSPVSLVMQEDAPSIYDLVDEVTVDPTPNTGLPDPWTVSPPSVLAVDSGTNHLLVQSDGTIITRVRISWAAATDAYMLSAGQYELLWRIAGRDAGNVWRSITSPGDSVGEYLVGANDGDVVNWQLTAINSLGRRSATVHGSHTVVGKTQPPQDVPTVEASLIYGAVSVRVPASTEPDVVGVVLRRGSSWAAGVPLTGSQPTIMRGSEYLWAWPPYGTYTIWAKYLDSTGHESATALGTSVVINDALKLGSKGIDVDLAGINLAGNSSFEIDRDGNNVGDDWSIYSNGSTGSITPSRTTGRLKGYAQRVSASALGTTDSDRAGVYRFIPIGPGAAQQLVVSAYCRGSVGRTYKLQVYAFAGGTFLDSAVATGVLSSSAWARPVVQFPSWPAAADTVRVYAWVQQGSGGSAYIEVDDVLVEEASLPSAWHPSPLDELVDTDAIKDGAATELAHATDTSPSSNLTSIAETAFSVAVDCQVVVNMECLTEIDASAETVTRHKWWQFYALIDGTGSTPDPTQLSHAGADDRSDISPGNIEIVSAVAQVVYALQAGGTYRAYGIFRNKVPQSSIAASPLNAVLRLEVIKR